MSKKHISQIDGSISFSGGIKETIIKRSPNTVGYLIAIYATLITVFVAIISVLPICEYLSAGLIVVIVIGLYYFLLRTTMGRSLVVKEITRLTEFEERYKSK